MIVSLEAALYGTPPDHTLVGSLILSTLLITAGLVHLGVQRREADAVDRAMLKERSFPDRSANGSNRPLSFGVASEMALAGRKRIDRSGLSNGDKPTFVQRDCRRQPLTPCGHAPAFLSTNLSVRAYSVTSVASRPFAM